MRIRIFTFLTSLILTIAFLPIVIDGQNSDNKPAADNQRAKQVDFFARFKRVEISPPASDPSVVRRGALPESARKKAASTTAFTWTGVYLGGNLGYGWGKGDTRFDPLPSATQFLNLAPTTLELKPNGWTAGGQGGYNWQSGNFVGGFESDFAWAKFDETKTQTPITQNNGTTFNGTLTASQETKWFGTLRGRAGGAWDRVFLYGTGGFAYGRVEYSANSDFRPQGTIQYPAAFEKNKTGWTIGGGGEVAINNHWSWRAQYLYIDFGNETITANPSPVNPPFQVMYSMQTKLNVFNSGFNYRW